MSEDKNTEVNQPEWMDEISGSDVDLENINKIGKDGIANTFQPLNHDFMSGMGEYFYTYRYGNFRFDDGIMTCDTIRQNNMIYRGGHIVLVSEEKVD